MNNLFSFFEDNISTINNANLSNGVKLENKLIDKTYLEFTSMFNGAYFFNNSLHFFRCGHEVIDYQDIQLINKIIFKYYKNFLNDMLFFFAEDVFGNLFGFEQSEKIIMFNIESGDKEVISSDFNNYLNALFNDIEYFTGRKYASDPAISNQLNKGYRLCPKYPFVLGGEYSSINLTLKWFEENYIFNSDIARQIKNHPDGTNFTISIISN